MDFENRAERKKLMEEFRKEAAAKNIEGYQKYAESMEALDSLMDEYCELDSFGIPKDLTADMQKKLIDAMNAVALSGDVYLKNVQEKAKDDPNISADHDVPGMVGKLQNMASKDLETISAYDPSAEKTSLPELLERARTRTIDVNQRTLTVLQGSQSSRLAMNVVDMKNQKHPGVFTKETRLDFMDKYNRMISEVKENANNEETEFLDSLLPKYKALIIKSSPGHKNQPDEFFANSLVRYLCGETDHNHAGNALDTSKYEALTKALGCDEFILGPTRRKKLSNGLQNLNDGVGHASIHMAGLNDGDRIDAANSGMSAVASLLGKPNMLAKSFAMNLRDSKGNITKGTFMDFSTGLDLNDSSGDDYKAVCNNPFQGTEGQLIKQLSDIQVIDYLCGNVDRHFGNLMYFTDGNGHIIGVQGIDNDCAFGRICDVKKGRKFLPGLDNMKCISESTAKKIEAMDPAMLKFALRGRGLNDQQIEASAERLKDMKKAIKEGRKHYKDSKGIGNEKKPFDTGYLRVVDDEDFKSLKMNQMYKKNSKKEKFSLFSEVDKYVNDGIKAARRLGTKYDPSYKKPKPDLKDGLASERKYTAKGLAEPLKGADGLLYHGSKKVDDLSQIGRGSKQFRDLVKASKLVAAYEDHFKKLEERGTALTAIDYRRTLQKYEAALNDLDEKADLYFDRKMKQKKVNSAELLKGKDDYEQDRIDYAKNVQAFAQDAKLKFKKAFIVPKDIEMTEDEKADYRAIKEQQSLDDRREAMKALEEFHKQHGMKSPQEMKKEQQEKKNGGPVNSL